MHARFGQHPLALWLLPDPQSQAFLHGLMKPLAKKAGMPLFPPHLTLSSGPGKSWRGNANLELPVSLKSVSMRLMITGVGCEPNFFRSVYLVVQPSAELEALYRVAAPLWQDEKPWSPHISLVYSDASIAEKRAWSHSIPQPIKPLTFDGCALWGPAYGKTWRDLTSWQPWP